MKTETCRAHLGLSQSRSLSSDKLVFFWLLLEWVLLGHGRLPRRCEAQEFLDVWPESSGAHHVDVRHGAVGQVLCGDASLGRALDQPGRLKGKLGHNHSVEVSAGEGVEDQEHHRRLQCAMSREAKQKGKRGEHQRVSRGSEGNGPKRQTGRKRE